ncbi:MAG: hypothetical protein PHZ16_06455 [Eubacteriales bacterium]|nr:hypothetical protein [Eubacteriales bacterium]
MQEFSDCISYSKAVRAAVFRLSVKKCGKTVISYEAEGKEQEAGQAEAEFGDN